MKNKINFNETYVLAGYGFDNMNPYFLLDSISEDISERFKFSIQDQVFSLIRLKKRYCIGRYNIETFESTPCPDKATLSEKNNTCFHCFQSIGFNPAFYNMPSEKLSPQQQRYNKQPHNVYLAYFCLNTIKVGIAYHKRTLTRWCQQGARAATIIKKCSSAYEARNIESLISRTLNLPESFNNKKNENL
ncbi:MAG: hypothetical protein OMM_01947 [Candidatus Magnetoglobus multicellularis str. Araruama]|uniref:Uncharacterized protein n=1 Tax=Candidatus Magnetoglobus multicellularis str. Araruama TaxID=890399 RepID=A0A1V1PBI1_9BACT|nr:MAG: hypothetical protein OMM_01947 [Candidatus Magnetoglobus multicellularis str. Araruama]